MKGPLKNLFLKLCVNDRAEAAIAALQHGIVHLRGPDLRRGKKLSGRLNDAARSRRVASTIARTKDTKKGPAFSPGLG